MASQAVTIAVHKRLQVRSAYARSGSVRTFDACVVCYRGLTPRQSRSLRQDAAQARFGGLYTQRNVALSGIHTHSGPGGYLQYVLYTITSLGFVRESFDTLVDGVVEVRLGAGSPRHAAPRFTASANIMRGTVPL